MTTRKEWQYAPLSEPTPDPAPISPKTTTAADASHLFDSESEQGSDEDVLFLNNPGVKDDEAPTLHELVTLHRVPAHIPPSAFLIALVELCERFAFYGLSGPFQNYISNGPGSANPGALGFGQAWATGLTSAFNMWCYLTSIAGAVVADQYVGKYSAIVIFSLFYLVGLVVLVVTALPGSIASGWAGWGLLLAMGIIGLGTGGIKANVAPLIAEQITEERIHIKTLKGGEKVLIDPDLTVQRIYMIFYLCINVGSLSGIVTTYMEHHSGFWTAYLLAACFFVLGVVVLILGRKHYVVKPPRGSVVMDAIKVIMLRFKSKDGFELAKPSIRRPLRLPPVTWDDSFVNEVQKTLRACRVLLFFPIYWAVYFQMMNNFVSQAGTMELHGIPNDVMTNIDPVTIIIFIPLLDRIIYPYLQKHHIPLSPPTRITLGFLFAALAMFYASFIQHLIYTAPPCFTSPLSCPEALQPDGTITHNKVHVLTQSPAYILVAVSEILASVTGQELAFRLAPSSMKSVVNAAFLLMTATGAAIAMLLAPIARDPRLGDMYLGLGVTAGVAGAGFWWCFGGLKIESEKEEKGEEVEMVGVRTREDG